MSLFLLSGPAIEPLTLADVKNWVRVTDGAEDGLLQSLIASARLRVEAATGRLLITQQWRLTIDAWPSSLVIDLPLMPVRSIAHLRIFDGSGAFIDVTPGLITLDAGDGRARLVLNAPPPSPVATRGGIQIDIVAGYGDTALAVPEPLRLAMLLLIASWHAHRGDEEAASAQFPAQVSALLAPYRSMRLI